MPLRLLSPGDEANEERNLHFYLISPSTWLPSSFHTPRSSHVSVTNFCLLFASSPNCETYSGEASEKRDREKGMCEVDIVSAVPTRSLVVMTRFASISPSDEAA